ncbi:unnamed protein product, partial [Musa textilis]
QIWTNSDFIWTGFGQVFGPNHYAEMTWAVAPPSGRILGSGTAPGWRWHRPAPEGTNGGTAWYRQN